MSPTADDLTERLLQSIGPAVFEDTTQLAIAPEPRISWVDLQHEVVALAPSLTENERRRLARALVRAVLEQQSYGPSNRLTDEAFAFLLGTLGDELAEALDPANAHPYGGQRYLRQHAWLIPGATGAGFLGRLATLDPISTNFLLQDMNAGKIPRWADEDWAARLDIVADLAAEPSHRIRTIVFPARPPRVATPAYVRVALSHAVDKRAPMIRAAARVLREFRGAAPEDDLDLVDWNDRHRRPELFRWTLELMGEAGYREQLVGAAASAALVPVEEAAVLSAPLDRPAWADRDVPWVVEEVVTVGSVALPSGRLTAGDPWWTGGQEGLPWVVALDVAAVTVAVVIAGHPLAGRQCAALVAHVAEGTVQKWRLVEGSVDPEGYHVEVGVGGFGSVECYDGGFVFESMEADGFVRRNSPKWQVVESPSLGGIAMCTVGPQHQLCRTWLGASETDAPLMLVTDLGLLDLDPVADSALPW